MAKLKIELTDELIKLISHIKFTEMPDLDTTEPVKPWAIDFHSLYGGNFLLEDIALILGLTDQRIKGTENDWQGMRFPEEIENHMLELHYYILGNLGDIEEIIHQFITQGGVKPGVYVSKSYEHIWKYQEK